MTLRIHPYANLFPLIEGQEFYDLAEDIRVNGLRDRIDMLGEQILDGRNRYRALVWLITTGEALGPGWGEGSEWGALHLEGKALTADMLRPESWFFWPFQPDIHGDPLDYVLSKNLSRRHLNDDQRRLIAAELVTMGKGRPGKMPQIAGFSRERAAAALSTDIAGVERARTVIAKAAPEVVEAVKSGAVSVAAAAEIASQPAERQAEIVAALPRDETGRLTPEVKKALAPVIKEIRAEKVAAKKERRESREQDLGRKLQALPEKSFGVAIEDFEWHHDMWSAETGSEKHPSMHYETAADARTPEEIAARCAERFACLAEDCVLFKWTTVPHLDIALQTLKLQGFRYVTSLVWNKERSGEARGTGYWFTGEHELVLVGVRGQVVPPAVAHFRSSFSSPVGAHSEKPDTIHEIVEFHWPNVPKVEFNARRQRPGWTAWGFDAPAATSSDVVGIAAQGQSEALPEAAQKPHGDPVAKADVDVDQGLAVDPVQECLAGPDLTESVSRPADGRSSAATPEMMDVTAGETATLSEFDALKLLSDYCYPDRAARAPLIAPRYIAQGLAFKFGGREDWSLTDRGWQRLRELEAERRAANPAPAPIAGSDDLEIPAFLRRTKAGQFEFDLAVRDRLPPEIVDEKIQTRLPLTEDELAIHSALRAIEAGEEIDADMLRHLVGTGFAHCGLSSVVITDEGREFLAALVPPVADHQTGAAA